MQVCQHQGLAQADEDDIQGNEEAQRTGDEALGLLGDGVGGRVQGGLRKSGSIPACNGSAAASG